MLNISKKKNQKIHLIKLFMVCKSTVYKPYETVSSLLKIIHMIRMYLNGLFAVKIVAARIEAFGKIF